MSNTVTAESMKKACETYVASFGRKDLETIVNLFAKDAVIHDPVGKPPRTDTTTVRDFFTQVVQNVYDARLDGPVRGSAGNAAAFAFQLFVEWPNGTKQVARAIDVMTFDAEGKIALMQAYHGPGDVVDLEPPSASTR